jgi:hypothetical protein
MAQYVVHKIGFWYTDECYAVGELSFHNIVEYSDEEIINPADYAFNEEGLDYIGF